MGRHDPDATASAEPYEAFAALVAMKHHLRGLLQEQVGRDEALLAQMRAASGSTRGR